MAGGLVNIVSYGAQDLFLTGTPQITFFKVVYRRHTNFSMEVYKVAFEDQTGFGVTSNMTVPMIGDLINRAYLRIVIPEISFNRIIDTNLIKDLRVKHTEAVRNMARFLLFTQANVNAFRAATDVMAAENIETSYEIVQVIKQIFSTYITPSSEIADSINFYYINSPIDLLPPSTFNLLVLAEKYADDIIPKDMFSQLLVNAVENNRLVLRYYEDQVRDLNTSIEDAKNPNFKFAWVDRLGHSIVKLIDVSIDGERIDREYGDWINIWYELAGTVNQRDIYMKMIGNVPELTTFDRKTKPEYIIYTPLQFWFNRFNGLALPLIALQYGEVTISVTLRKFRECAYIENLSYYKDKNYRSAVNLDGLFNRTGKQLDVSLLIDYIFLDSLERRRFAQVSHEYLIDQIQWLDFDDVQRQDTFQIDLDFNNPTRELIWILRKRAYIDNSKGFTKCRWDNYSLCKENKGMSILFATIDFAGQSRVDRRTGAYFNYVQPFEHHTHTPSDGINVYSFAIRPEEHQPTGSCNFSRISHPLMTLWIDPLMFYYFPSDITDDPKLLCREKEVARQTNIDIRVFAPNINILRFMSGLGGTAYV